VDRLFRSLCQPDLINYSVLVNGGAGHIGSGVLVNLGGRHFVATAQHLLKKNRVPQVLVSPSRVTKEMSSVNPISIPVIQSGQHDDLDLAYLEIADPKRAELEWSQLCSALIDKGQVHIVGFPEVLHEIDRRRREYSVVPAVFSTTLRSETDEVLRFEYPEIGARNDDRAEAWVKSHSRIRRKVSVAAVVSA